MSTNQIQCGSSSSISRAIGCRYQKMMCYSLLALKENWFVSKRVASPSTCVHVIYTNPRKAALNAIRVSSLSLGRAVLPLAHFRWHLQQEGMEAVRMCGNTKMRVREEIMQNFADPASTCRILLISLQVGGDWNLKHLFVLCILAVFCWNPVFGSPTGHSCLAEVKA